MFVSCRSVYNLIVCLFCCLVYRKVGRFEPFTLFVRREVIRPNLSSNFIDLKKDGLGVRVE